MSKNILKDSLKRLKEIVEWFDKADEVDIEAGLEKVKEGTVLIKESRRILKDLENEFEKVKDDLEKDETDESDESDELNNSLEIKEK